MQIPRRPTRNLEDDSPTYKRPIPVELSLRRAAIAAKSTQQMPTPKVSGPLHITPAPRNPITPVPTGGDDWLLTSAPVLTPEPVIFKDSKLSTIDLVFSVIHTYMSLYRSMPTQLIFGKAIRRLEMSKNEYHLPGTRHVISVSYEPGDYDILVR